MHMWQAIARQPLGVVIGFVGASALFLLAFGLAFASGRVLATHDASGNVHACVNVYNGQTKVLLPGRPPNCGTAEMLVEWAGAGVAVDLAALQAEVDALQAQVPDCLATEGDDAVFESCNVHVRNGLDTTSTVNGSGNLIIGYNEATGGLPRGGSHNLVVGSEHSYSSYGGLVAGFANAISGAYASVSGGELNTASGPGSSVSGGAGNTASDVFTSVSGGLNNEASGNSSSVSGGDNNVASGELATVSGGLNLTADDTHEHLP